MIIVAPVPLSNERFLDRGYDQTVHVHGDVHDDYGCVNIDVHVRGHDDER